MNNDLSAVDFAIGDTVTFKDEHSYKVTGKVINITSNGKLIVELDSGMVKAIGGPRKAIPPEATHLKSYSDGYIPFSNIINVI
jgi:hypothetical protein